MAKLTINELSQIRELIKTFDFKALFNYLGWDNPKLKKTIPTINNQYLLTPIAEKRGFSIFLCLSDLIPNQIERKKIDREINIISYEHLIIYCDNQHSQQIWQFAIKEINKPIQHKETHYYSHQEPQLLLEKLQGVFFSFDDEENISLIDVIGVVNESFNSNTEKVTKKFYADFTKQHKTFITFINGLDKNQENKHWYASLMLNRLMFIYFIQKKGFLDNDFDYLRNKLNQIKTAQGNDQFYSFYRHFLLKLFHQGLGKEHQDDKELIKLIGRVPYLNGGLFDVHELEQDDSNTIQIKDEAFEQLFDFFDKYQWHLDTNASATGNEINPDVIGYIFEKYINDRAAMGAYYTKEDITEYISKNTILPFLFDKAKTECANAFKTDSSLWQLLTDNPDRYIYDAVKKGCDYNDIPENIAIGINSTEPNLLERRKDWNTPTPEQFALPTEIWRETIARRQRYFELKAKLMAGEITEINDFISYNLNIRQFAQDALEYYEGSDFIEAFYHAIETITVLDPTCGSGAFLFAALNILEPLYEVCIKRMREFTENAPAHKFKKFRAILADIDKHPNSRYWIYKTIILNNLYGVDIMQEAVEIAKLRLFLKLAAMASVDSKKPNLGLEPLPDIDFNIRCGNTLIGYTTHEQIKKAVEYDVSGQAKLFVDDSMVLMDTMIEELQGVLRRYKANQLANNSVGLHEDKQEITARLNEIKESLDWFLARDYGIDADNKKQLAAWKQSHHPFHWFTEFFHIMNQGGFDVIISNPPYVEYSKVKKDYLIKGYQTESCGNLYAFVMERTQYLIKDTGLFGMIVPVSLNSTDRMSNLRDLLYSNTVYLSSFADRPSCLFSGVHQILSIFISRNINVNNFFNAGFKHWNKDERCFLFDNLFYLKLDKDKSDFKISDNLSLNIVNKIKNQKTDIIQYFVGKSHLVTYSGGTGGYWLRAFNETQSSNEYKIFYVDSLNRQMVFVALFNSSLFYLFWRLVSDCRHLTKNDIAKFKIKFDSDNKLDKLIEVSTIHQKELKNTIEIREGKMTYEQYRPSKVKPIIDEIDKVLAEHYGFTEEELDFIINYDIKYRMGKELD